MQTAKPPLKYAVFVFSISCSTSRIHVQVFLDLIFSVIARESGLPGSWHNRTMIKPRRCELTWFVLFYWCIKHSILSLLFQNAWALEHHLHLQHPITIILICNTWTSAKNNMGREEEVLGDSKNTLGLKLNKILYKYV